MLSHSRLAGSAAGLINGQVEFDVEVETIKDPCAKSVGIDNGGIKVERVTEIVPAPSEEPPKEDPACPPGPEEQPPEEPPAPPPQPPPEEPPAPPPQPPPEESPPEFGPPNATPVPIRRQGDNHKTTRHKTAVMGKANHITVRVKPPNRPYSLR